MKIQITLERPRLPRRRSTKLALALVAALVVAVPIAWANHTFVDVPTSSPHHDDISTIRTAGITQGCNPPTNNMYCPDQAVRRDQMASFLQRGLGRLSRTVFSFPTTTAGAVLAETQITTPGTVYLRAEATFYSFMLSGQSAGAFPCSPTYYVSIDGSINDFNSAALQTVQTAPAQLHFWTSSAERIAVVGPGTHTVRLIFDGNEGGTCATQTGRGTLSAEMIPFGATGAGASSHGAPKAERAATATR